jgi:hypothetical protein
MYTLWEFLGGRMLRRITFLLIFPKNFPFNKFITHIFNLHLRATNKLRNNDLWCRIFSVSLLVWFLMWLDTTQASADSINWFTYIHIIENRWFLQAYTVTTKLSGLRDKRRSCWDDILWCEREMVQGLHQSYTRFVNGKVRCQNFAMISIKGEFS